MNAGRFVALCLAISFSGFANESVEALDRVANDVSRLSSTVQLAGVHVAGFLVESVKGFLVVNEDTKLFCGGGNGGNRALFVVIPSEPLGFHDHNQGLFPVLEGGKQFGPAGFFRPTVGVLSVFALPFQRERVNGDPSDHREEGSDDDTVKAGFLSGYFRALPFCLLLFGVSGYICYRHGRWVERNSHSRNGAGL